MTTTRRFAGLMMLIFGQSLLLCIFGLWSVLGLSVHWPYFAAIGFATLLMCAGGMLFFFGGNK